MKIEKGVPIPAGMAIGATATMKTMEVGDSFLASENKRHNYPSLAKRIGIKVCVKKVGDGQVRVWRIE